MTEFIGSRISLISKRDIRYVGTLHEINSESSTVALEQVVSYGTEGRRPDDEIPPSLENVYEYIVFRGSDVKDLRIEGGPIEHEPPKPPKMPDDPAILGSMRKPPGPAGVPKVVQGGQNPAAHAEPPPSQGSQHDKAQHQPQQHHGPPQQPHGPSPFPHQPFPYQFPPPNARFGPQGFSPGPPGHGFPGMPYGGAPGWYPPYGYPHGPPGQFPPHQMPTGPPNPGQRPPHIPPSGPPDAPLAGDSGLEAETPSQARQSTGPKPVTVKLPGSSGTPGPLQNGPNALPTTSFDNGTKVAPGAQPKDLPEGHLAVAGVKSARLVPVVPFTSPGARAEMLANGTSKATSINETGAGAPKTQLAENVPTKTLEEANRDARAAVAAAMAKLPTASSKRQDGTMDHLTNKISELATDDGARASRQTGPISYAPGNRGSRGGARRGRDPPRRNELPKSDYDFETANAKFNKQDLVKEAIATGSPVASPGADGAVNGMDTDQDSVVRKDSTTSVHVPAGASYDRQSSFFDDISSESKDRAQREDSGQKLGGREFRNEERQKNFETFGQGSVDNSYRRGGARGRGRGGFGRGRGGRGGGRGYPRNGRPVPAGDV